MKRRNFLAGMVAAAAVAGCTCNPCATNMATAVSPDGHNEIRFQLKPFAYEVLRDGRTLVAKTAVGMKVDFDVCTKFLGAGEWTAEIFRDAPNADVEPAKYVHETKVVKAGDKFAVHMAPGGGFVVKFAKK